MKLLGWMHRKIRQNSCEPFKDFPTVQSTLDDQDRYSNRSFASICGCLSSKLPKQEFENSIADIKAKEADESFNEETSEAISELFHGFLAIGTLGSEPIISEPATPTFATSLDNIVEEKTEVTEYDLKLINSELEKFLDAEAEEERSNESSRRNSYVSIVTICEKPVEGDNAKDYGRMQVCPLQGYLFGSSAESPETVTEVKKEKASLGELFRRTKIREEQTMNKDGKEEMLEKQTSTSVKHLIKKMQKMFHASSRGHPASDTGPASSKKKLNKVMKMLHRKIHPENNVADKEFVKSYKEKKIISYDGGYGGGSIEQLEKNDKSFQGSKPKEWTEYCKNNRNLQQNEYSCSISGGNKEHWIKTDADYLVLEL